MESRPLCYIHGCSLGANINSVTKTAHCREAVMSPGFHEIVYRECPEACKIDCRLAHSAIINYLVYSTLKVHYHNYYNTYNSSYMYMTVYVSENIRSNVQYTLLKQIEL